MAVKVTVIGGFLGVGKTTLLNHLIGAMSERRLGVIVNDFGAINVDAGLVVGVDGDLVELSNGCICCSIRDDLRESLERLLSVPEPPEHVIIEASGVSDPRRVASALAQQMSRDLVTIDAVVVVIDAEAYRDMGRRERIVVGGQLAAADILVLNKVDRVEPDEADALEQRLRRAARRARRLRASYGRVSPALLLGVGAADPGRHRTGEAMDVHVHELTDAHGSHDHGSHDHGSHDHASHDHPHHGVEYWTWSFRSEQPLGARRLRRAINALPDSVVRAKGWVHLASHPETRAVMHVVGRRAELCLEQPWGARSPRTELVLIGCGESPSPEELERQFTACEVEPGQGGPAQAVMRWVRRVWPSREAG